MGENNLAATSSGKLFCGGQLRHKRDCFLNFRRRLQSNGSKSAKQLLKKVSGREARHVRHVNHEVSKAIVAEAIENGYSIIALEKLTNIRKRIKAGKRMRSRLHRWAWWQLQEFIAYKAQGAGIQIVFVNPAYTSKTCYVCGNLGIRSKHRFSCPICGRLAHSDRNAAQNIASLGSVYTVPTGDVNRPNVATLTD
jgi:IS605 OrfB family transposase